LINVLLVEDDPAASRLTVEALRDALVSNHVDEVADGEAALDFLKRNPPFEFAPRPDLVLLDLSLPKIDGRDLLARMKSDPALMEIPVVVLSASDNPKDIRDAYRLHASCFITKPSELDEYFSSIRLLKELWFKVAKFPEHAEEKS
jgi:chemotaxis family two-component system response regulator Rcp1